jgi:uncharacterized membrane protein
MVATSSSFMAWIGEFGRDAVAMLVSVLLVTAYYAFLLWQRRRNPTYTIHAINEIARRRWVEHLMGTPGMEIIGVQTLRNFVMGASLMASTATFLIMGTLTLSGQVDKISHSWHILNIGGSHSAELWIIKVLCLLIVFIVAFFAFALSVRLSNHVVFMLNVPVRDNQPAALTPAGVARRLNRAGNMFAVGVRAYFFAVPLVFWLFGPAFLVAATIGLVIVLYHLDRNERQDV